MCKFAHILYINTNNYQKTMKKLLSAIAILTATTGAWAHRASSRNFPHRVCGKTEGLTQKSIMAKKTPEVQELS